MKSFDFENEIVVLKIEKNRWSITTTRLKSGSSIGIQNWDPALGSRIDTTVKMSQDPKPQITMSMEDLIILEAVV